MIITLCGSTRFRAEYEELAAKLAMMGHVVLTVSSFARDDGISADDKELLDLMHFQRIEMSDAIVVINRGGYVGDSTRREVRWARLRRKGVFWLEPGSVQGQPATGVDYIPNVAGPA